MSFEKPPTSYPCMEYWVKTEATNAFGVCILFLTPGCTWEVIYVGDADDFQKRLLGHLNGDIPCIATKQPTAFIYELADADRRVTRRDGLIGEYDLPCQ